jgi:cysteine desulfurase
MLAGSLCAAGAQSRLMPPPIYLDYQATTPLDRQALSAMMPYLQGQFGNPHSTTHRYGWEGKAGVDVARGQVAALIGAVSEDVIFTSGATESNNLAIRGAMQVSKRKRIVTLATEHSCVLETAQLFDAIILPVGADGLLQLDALRAALDESVALVSIMHVNNEIGVIQPVAKIAKLAHGAGALMHCDAAQSVGKIPVDVAALGVDLLSVSAHKLYGPKGIGALYVKPGTQLAPQMSGGGQERGLRSGTLAPALCAGFGKACEIATPVDDFAPVWHKIVDALTQAGINFQINGSSTQRFFGNLNISFPGRNGERLLADLRGLALSSGAACASAAGKKSYVLDALGVPEKIAQATLRIGFGRMTTEADIDIAIDKLIKAVMSQ